MPKSEPSLMADLRLPTRPNPSGNSQKIRINSPLEAALDGRLDPGDWAFKRADSDSDPAEPYLKTLDRSARSLALVSLMPRDHSTTSDLASADVTFTEYDPHACPRDLEEFKLAVALELDKLREDKKIYE
jgi:hypothetical protein